MQLATDSEDYAEGSIGLVEYASNLLNDRKRKWWSKAELISWINEEQHKIAARINRTHRHFFLTAATTAVVPDQDYYAMPSDMVKLFGIEVGESGSDTDPQPLVEIPLRDRDFYQMLDRANEKRELGYFFVAGTQFRPMPAMSGAGTIRIHYVKRLDRLVDNDDTSAIPEEHHELLAIGAARRALVKKREANPALDALYAEGISTLDEAIVGAMPHTEDHVEPWWGTYGPGTAWDL